ncbi:MAG: hypothetical protein O9266_04360 [Porphyrobacter sp.]|nr:hypothetical protein [Porphyrobacter sp.]
MSGYWSVRHTRGYDRFPEIRGYGTIPADDARHDDLNDFLAAKLRQFWRAQNSRGGWTNELERLRIDVERICELNGYKGLWVDARDYLVHRVGQSFLYDVPMGKRGNLADFAGKRIRVVCSRNGINQRYVRIGVVGDAPEQTKARRQKASGPTSVRPRLPRLLSEDELAYTPHMLVRFRGIWTGAGGMARAYNRGLRYQAAVWHARRFREWAGVWPKGIHEFVIKFGPTDDFEIRTPIGDHQGYLEVELHFEVHSSGSEFVEGNEEVGFNWCAFSLEELEGKPAECR